LIGQFVNQLLPIVPVWQVEFQIIAHDWILKKVYSN
jgi:hypothetical protein